MRLGDKVRAARQSHYMTISALAQNSGLTKGFISLVERSLANPSLSSLDRIASALHVPMQSLLHDGSPSNLMSEPPAFRLRIFRREDSDRGDSQLNTLFNMQTGPVLTAHLEPGDVLEPVPTIHGQERHRVLCVLVSGEAVFQHDLISEVLYEGDMALSSDALRCRIENSASTSAFVLLFVEGDQDKFILKKSAFETTVGLRKAAGGHLESGPLRLVAMREQMRKHRGG